MIDDSKQIFLLHFAGGSSYSYDFLKKILPRHISAISLELPGRGKRYEESLIFCKEEAINDYVRQINTKRNRRPYLVYGHSMGATLGLSVARMMEEIGDPPSQLIVSGNPGPCINNLNSQEGKRKRYLLDDSDFKKSIRKLGGVPEEVLINDELYSFFSPIIRADFQVLESSNYSEKGIKLKIPIYALMGSEETDIDKIRNWKNFTTENFTSKILSGNHFFIYDHPDILMEIMVRSS